MIDKENMILLDELEVKTETDKVVNAIKQLEKDALQELDRICRKNGIEYSICGGTLLGAVRHGGFIPWDDDIDVDFMADEYYKFIEACERDLDKERFFLYTHDVDPKFNDFPAKLLVKDTLARSRAASFSGIPLTIGVDLFKQDYMPNDKKKRISIIRKLTILRQVCFAKSYREISMIRIAEDRTSFVRFLINKVPRRFIYNYIRKLEVKCNRKYKDSDYLMDNFIYRENPEHDGKPNYAKEGYEDIKFEDLTVRKFKDHHSYMVKHYGDNYMEMPPVESRISHHKFFQLDLDKYKERFGLADDYKKYMTVNMTGEQLINMKNLCMDMVEEVGRICDKHGITYWLSGDDILFKASGIEEMSKLFRKPPCVMFDVKNMRKFNEVVMDELDEKYFYQSTETDSEFIFHYPRIVLNGTQLNDRSHYPHKIHPGLWINLGILLNAPDDEKEANEYYEELRNMHKTVRFNLLYDDERVANLMNFKMIRVYGIESKDEIMERRTKEYEKIQEAKKFTKEELLEKRKELYTRYENEDTSYYVDASTGMLKSPQLRKENFGKGIKGTFLGREVNLPCSIEGACDDVCKFIPKRRKKYEKIANMKKENPEKYKEVSEIGGKKFLKSINVKFTTHNMVLYDLPEYQQTVWRLDI